MSVVQIGNIKKSQHQPTSLTAGFALQDAKASAPAAINFENL
jgi:hypothetical protein